MSTALVAVDFDTNDAEYLAAIFSLKQLRAEIYKADIEAAVARQFDEEESEAYWRQYLSTAKEAIELAKTTAPKAKYRGTGFIDIPTLKAKLDIVEIANQYTDLKKSGRNFTGLCPIHSEECPSFYVYHEQQTWHCFGACNMGGDVISLVMAVERVDFRGAIALLEAKL